MQTKYADLKNTTDAPVESISLTKMLI